MSDTPEHVRIVDDACVMYFGKVISVTLGEGVISGEPLDFTLGEISAIAGDFFASPEELREWHKAEDARDRLSTYRNKINESKDLLRPMPDQDGTVADSGARDKLSILEAVLFRGHRFIQLAIDNHVHFRKGRPASSWSECTRYHKAALGAASREEKILQEGFSLHFLVDMFAAGHMRTPRTDIQEYLADGTSLAVNPLSRLKTTLEHAPLIGAGLGGAVVIYDVVKGPSTKYHPRNAQIIGALLSLAQHDRDNYGGLRCKWTGPVGKEGVDPRPAIRTDVDDWRGDPSGLLRGNEEYRGILIGDDSFHALELVERSDEIEGGIVDDDERPVPEKIPEPGTAEDRRREKALDDHKKHPKALNAKKHLFGTIAAHVLHVFPELAVPTTPAPWPGEGDASHEEFLHRVIPTLVKQGGGWMQVSSSDGHTIVHWHGPRVVYPFSWARLVVETHKDGRIKYVTLEVPLLQIMAIIAVGTGGAYFGNVVPVPFDNIAEYALPMDGNDPKVRELFDDANIATWLIANQRETNELQANVVMMSLKKAVQVQQSFEEWQLEQMKRLLAEGKQLTQQQWELQKRIWKQMWDAHQKLLKLEIEEGRKAIETGADILQDCADLLNGPNGLGETLKSILESVSPASTWPL